MSEENKAAARRLLEVFATGDFSAIDELVAPNAIDHDPYNPHGSEGVEGSKKTIAMYREAFPDLQMTVEDQVAEGDKVVTRWTAVGTHEGNIMGIPATGKTATVTGIGIDRFEDGKVVEGWNNWDTLGLLQQIGAIPEPQAAQA
jgi:steroid delta-isomerase-like uncharacterized protein